MRGFTLVEVVIVLAILALLLGILAPMAFQLLDTERAAVLEQELQVIHTAIVGTPEKGLFGYVGDVGNYPNTLLDLVRPPVDAASVPLPGWKGPYVQHARIENGAWLDPYGRPYEYYLAAGLNSPDRLAILSRGLDGLGSNESPTPADAATFAGPVPTDPAYPAAPGNGDNVLFPKLEGNPTAFNVKTDGDVAFDILNWDSNVKLNALVPACPQLYTIAVTSIPRRTVEASMAYVQGLSFNLAQGLYRVSAIPRGLTTTSWAGTLAVQPGGTVARTLNLSGLDSSGTPPFNLTVKNGFTTTDLEIYEFDDKLNGTLLGQPTGASATLKVGETRVYTPRGCAQIYVRVKGKTDVVDQFVMPYGAFTRQEGTQAATLGITNLFGHDHHDHGDGGLHHHQHQHRNHGHFRLFVYRNDILLGTVGHHRKDVEFDDLLAGDKITIFDPDGNILASLTLVVGTNTVTVGG